MSEFILLSPSGSMIKPSNGSIIGVKTYLTIKGGASNAVPHSFRTKGAPGTNTDDWHNICRITDSGICLFDQTGYAAQGVASYSPLPCRVIRLCRDVT